MRNAGSNHGDGEMYGFIIGVVIVLASYWLNGYDFDARGDQAAAAFLISLCAGVAGRSLQKTMKLYKR